MMIRSALAVLVASLALGLTASKAPGQAYVSNCGTLEEHPAAIVLTCADANYALAGLRWSDWSHASAAATGEVRANDCTPNCAAGHIRRYKVKVVADRLTRCAGRPVYLRVTLTFLGDLPPGHKSPDSWTFTCARAVHG